MGLEGYSERSEIWKLTSFFLSKKSGERAEIKEVKLKAAGGNEFEKGSDERAQGHPITLTR
jgi:hypothetical protein